MLKIKHVSMFGPFRYPTGYSNVVRNYAKQFNDNGVIVGLHDFEKWADINNRIPVDGLFDQLEERRNVVDSDVVVAFCLPEQIHDQECPHQGKVVVNYTMFEADGICRQWADFASATNIIAVPTQFNKEGWIRSGVNPNRIRVCPLGVDTGKFSPSTERLTLGDDYGELVDQYKHRFLNIQEISDRKNLDGMLKAWMIATRGVGDAILILKLSSYSENRFDFFGKKLEKIRKEIGITKGEHAPICVYSMMLQDFEMPMLMQNCTHYISSSRGEGWDLNAAGAASMGKQLVVPRNTAYPEYLTHANFVECDKVPAIQKGALSRLYKDLSWFEIQHEDMVSQIQHAMKHSHPSNRENMVAKFGWDVVYKHLLDVCDEASCRGRYKHRPLIPSAEIAKNKTAGNTTMVACKSYANGAAKCGIAEYTKTLVAALSQGEKSGVAIVGGNPAQWLDHIDNNDVSTLHIQHEYQFHPPNELRFLLNQSKRRGVKTVITQHTINEKAPDHNRVIKEHADMVLVHSEASKKALLELGYKEEKIGIVPMPCKAPLLADAREVVPIEQQLPVGKKIIGFFGFAYFHKGIDLLIKTLDEMGWDDDTVLVMFATKPEQDIFSYYEQCKRMLEARGKVGKKDYWWFDQYHSEEEIVLFLNMCDLIVLPYKDYGGVGTSAALSTALRSCVPTIVSPTCWFDHADPEVVGRFVPGFLGDSITRSLNMPEEDKKAWKDRIREYVLENNWEKSALCHKKIYKKLRKAGTITS